MSNYFEDYEEKFDSYDDEEGYEAYDGYDEDGEKLNLADEIADLGRMLKRDTEEISRMFVETTDAFEEYKETFGEDLADDPDFIRDNMAFTSIKVAEKVIVGTFRSLSNFLGAASMMLGVDSFENNADTDNV